MQRQIFNSYRGRQGKHASRFGAILATAGLLLLSACDGGGSAVTENNLPEPGADGAPPVLTTVTMQPNSNVEAGDQVKIEFKASEAIMTPVVTINGMEAEVTGKILEWSAVHTITEGDPEGFVTFEISYQDISGNLGETVTATTNNRVACYGEEGVICPDADDLGPLEGNWKLDFAGVGPAEGNYDWFQISASSGNRGCWFDDIYQFGRDGSFMNVQGDESWVEPWQGAAAEGCGVPVAPHDGSNAAVFEYDEVAETLKLTGLGAYLGLPKVVNDGELADPGLAPESITYNVVELIGDSLTVRISIGGGWWEFRLTRISNLPIVGKWKLDFAGVGPAEGNYDWFQISASSGNRACWFDDIYHFGGDGSFRNFQEGVSWVEPWQGAAAEGCGVPIAPHDGSAAGAWIYDEAGGTVTLNGLGSYLGLPKVVNDAELSDPADAPDFVSYQVVELIGDSMTVRISIGGGWWEFRFERIADTADLRGNWKLDFAGVGPAEGNYDWFQISASSGNRGCWFDDIYQFGRDGSFMNVQGDESWVEPWQGAAAEGCGVPVAPHDGSNAAVFEYDEVAETLKLTGLGAYLGLPKVVNDGELADPGLAPESVTYNVVELIGDSLTVRISIGGGWWEFRLIRVSTLPIVGNWELDFAGVGPAEGNYDWFQISASSGNRACWFDDIYHFGDDGSFRNFQEGASWVEPWQGAAAEGCGVPIAPHDGSAAGAWLYGDGTTLTLNGLGSYLGLPKVVNDAELSDPADAPDFVSYQVIELIGDSMTVRISIGGGWWDFEFVRK